MMLPRRMRAGPAFAAVVCAAIVWAAADARAEDAPAPAAPATPAAEERPGENPWVVQLTARAGWRWGTRTRTGGLSPAKMINDQFPQGVTRLPDDTINQIDFGLSSREGPELRVGGRFGGAGFGGSLDFVFSQQRTTLLTAYELTLQAYEDGTARWLLVSNRRSNVTLHEVGGAAGVYYRFRGLAPFVPLLEAQVEVASLSGGNINFGLTAYGRLTAGFEVFATDWFGLRVEGAYFVGGVVASTRVTNLGTGSTLRDSPTFGFGQGGSLLIGITAL